MPSVNVCPGFWKDLKTLQKLTKNKDLQPQSTEDAEECSDSERIDNIPLARAIKNEILNHIKDGKIDNFKHDVQPFLDRNWTVYKIRYGIDKTGKSGGLRIIFCLDSDGTNLLFVHACKKNNCPDEKNLRTEIVHRVATYLGL